MKNTTLLALTTLAALAFSAPVALAVDASHKAPTISTVFAVENQTDQPAYVDYAIADPALLDSSQPALQCPKNQGFAISAAVTYNAQPLGGSTSDSWASAEEKVSQAIIQHGARWTLEGGVGNSPTISSGVS